MTPTKSTTFTSRQLLPIAWKTENDTSLFFKVYLMAKGETPNISVNGSYVYQVLGTSLDEKPWTYMIEDNIPTGQYHLRIASSRNPGEVSDGPIFTIEQTPQSGMYPKSVGDTIIPTECPYPNRGVARQSKMISFILAIVPACGHLAVNRFYNDYIGLGVAKLLIPNFNIWWLVDWILILVDGLPSANGCPLL
jgi:hypothetical protein